MRLSVLPIAQPILVLPGAFQEGWIMDPLAQASPVIPLSLLLQLALPSTFWEGWIADPLAKVSQNPLISFIASGPSQHFLGRVDRGSACSGKSSNTLVPFTVAGPS